MNKTIIEGWITIWIMLLYEFCFTILGNPGKENLVAYFLSRIHNEGEIIPIDDHFYMNIYLLYLFTLTGLNMYITTFVQESYHNICH